MTQTETTLAAQPTVFSQMIDAATGTHETSDYRGVLTPRALDAPAIESAALASSAAGHDLGWLRRVAVRGEDRFRWLSGMVTNMVNDLGDNAGAYNLVLNAQGRIQGDLNIWREKDQIEIEIAADQYEVLLAHLERFIVMDDVELVPFAGRAAVGLTGPAANEVLGRIGLPTLSEPMTRTRLEWNGIDLRIARHHGTLATHYALWVPEAQIGKLWKFLRTAGAVAVGSRAFEAFHIAEGIPAFGAGIAERDLPQETSQTRALNFNKGCYLGQEIVERIRSRGAVHKHLRQLELTGPIPAQGTDLALKDSTVIGQFRIAAEMPLASGTRTFALAMIKDEPEPGEQTFSYAAGSATGTARLLASPPRLS